MDIMLNNASADRVAQLAIDEENYRNEELKKAILSYPPRWITIGITSACNNRCVFCSYHSDDAREASNVYNVPFSLRLTDFKRMVDMAWRARVPRVHICGTGEPFLNKQVMDMVDCAISFYGEVSIQTNFYKKIFDRHDYLRKIIQRNKAITYITTDFLSGIPAQHDELKKGSSYQDVMRAIKYISDNSDIRIDVHFLLTRINYETLPMLIKDIAANGLRNCTVTVVNLLSYDFNEFTASDAVYVSQDKMMTSVLRKAVETGREYGIPVGIPQPADVWSRGCNVFWQKVQVWPVRGNDPTRYHENLIPHACRAVVVGRLSSLGYLFDFDDLMDFWNSEPMVTIRQGIIDGCYPDKQCRHCYCYGNQDGIYRQIFE